MRHLIVIVWVVAFLAIGSAARAQIIPPTTVVYSGNVTASDQLSIQYVVTQTGDLYTYSYVLTTSPSVELTSFTIGNSLNPVNTQSAAILSSSGASFSGFTSNSIFYEWGIPSDTTSADVSYTSLFAPTFATFSVTGGDGWTSPSLIPAPAPVPESSTILAGALMLLPFSVGAFRAWRKDRWFKP